jgi:hypothetical protein
MKRGIFLLLVLCVLKMNAQVYLIDFAASGASSVLSSIKAENLTAGTSVNLNGGDVLRLNMLTAISDINDNHSSKLTIFPNPMVDNSTISVCPSEAGDATITVSDITGKPVYNVKVYLENLRQDFKISGLKNGFYLNQAFNAIKFKI